MGFACLPQATTDIEPEEIQSSPIMMEVLPVGPPHGGSAALMELMEEPLSIEEVV